MDGTGGRPCHGLVTRPGLPPSPGLKEAAGPPAGPPGGRSPPTVTVTSRGRPSRGGGRRGRGPRAPRAGANLISEILRFNGSTSITEHDSGSVIR